MEISNTKCKPYVMVARVNKDTNEIEKYYSTTYAAAADNNINPSSIGKCCRGVKYKTVGGYKWQYVQLSPSEFNERMKRK